MIFQDTHIPPEKTVEIFMISKNAEKFKYVSPQAGEFKIIKDMIFDLVHDDEKAKSIILCCEESFLNIVSYSGASKVGYLIEEKEEIYEVAFADDGFEFDPTLKNGTTKEFEELDSGGMGIAIMRSIAKDIQYERKGESNILTLIFEK